jgi:hypothetical protein
MITRSIPIAAYLMERGSKLVRAQQPRPQHVDFYFDDPEAERIADEFHQGGKVTACEYFRAIQEIRLAVTKALGVRRGF